MSTSRQHDSVPTKGLGGSIRLIKSPEAIDPVNTHSSLSFLDKVESSKGAALTATPSANGHTSGQRAAEAINLTATRTPGGSVYPRRIRKREAIDCVNSCYQGRILNSRNTRFANVNATVDVWWLDIPRTMYNGESPIHLLLYDYRSGLVEHLKVPSSYFRKKQSDLVVRRDNGSISIYLSTDSSRLFQDTHRGVSFAPV
jgi:hypothetical protein